jgi:hypothetical protein
MLSLLFDQRPAIVNLMRVAMLKLVLADAEQRCDLAAFFLIEPHRAGRTGAAVAALSALKAKAVGIPLRGFTIDD